MKCAMPLQTAKGGRSTKGGKGGQRPWFRSSIRVAAQRADSRRARGKHGNWLRACPRGSSQSNNGNAGRPPAYSAAPYNGKSWRAGGK